MNTMTLLALITLIGVAALFIALAVFLVLIAQQLENIGGAEIKLYGTRASFLSRIRVGVRAIEVETGALAPLVTRLNGGLSAIRDGLVAIDKNLADVITAVSAQGEK